MDKRRQRVPGEQYLNKVRSMLAKTSQMKMQRAEICGVAKFLWDEGYLLYFRKFPNKNLLRDGILSHRWKKMLTIDLSLWRCLYNTKGQLFNRVESRCFNPKLNFGQWHKQNIQIKFIYFTYFGTLAKVCYCYDLSCLFSWNISR